MMNKDNDRKNPSVIDEGTGAKGGRKALKSDQQSPMGVEPDSEVDAKLRSKRSPPGGLDPNSIVRN